MKTMTIAALAATLGNSAALAQTTAAKPPAPAAKAAPALPAPPRTDVNCLLVSNIFAQQSTDANQKAHAQNVFFYYFGRLDARSTEAQLRAEVKQAGTMQLNGETAGTLMNSCVQNMQTRAQVLQSAAQPPQPGR
jgi:hypothetical protein